MSVMLLEAFRNIQAAESAKHLLVWGERAFLAELQQSTAQDMDRSDIFIAGIVHRQLNGFVFAFAFATILLD